MARYVAFIRGINVGGSAVAKMDSIKRQFEALGLENVVTVLASGNVVFDARALDEDVLSKKLGAKLGLALGRKVHVIVRQAGSIINLVDGIPFAHVKAVENVRLLVTLLPNGTAGSGLEPRRVEGLRVVSRSGIAIFSTVTLRQGFGTPNAMKEIERMAGRMVTTRTWETLVKIRKIL